MIKQIVITPSFLLRVLPATGHVLVALLQLLALVADGPECYLVPHVVVHPDNILMPSHLIVMYVTIVV
jgi:hypothetical protein